VNLLICRCGDGKPKVIEGKHHGRIQFGLDRLQKPWVGIDQSKRSKRRDRRKRHDQPYKIQVFSPPSWSSHTWIGYR
jgi:hypothetical protein